MFNEFGSLIIDFCSIELVFDHFPFILRQTSTLLASHVRCLRNLPQVMTKPIFAEK